MLAYKFRLYPNKQEERKLLWTKEICRCTYNRFLEEYNNGEHDRNKLQALLPVWKESNKDLKDVHSKVLQYELYRLFSNLSALKKLKRHRKVGKLRFKSQHRFRTFTYNQSGFKFLPRNDKFGFLYLSKIGDIPIRLHREVAGDIKGVTIKHFPSGKWYAYLLVDDKKADEIMFINKAVGIDVGLERYTVDSDGQEVENPRWLKRGLKKLQREQRKLHKKELGSLNREKQRVIVARKFERIQNQRNDFQHKLAKHYVDEYDMIVTEKLQPLNMVHSQHLSRNISDAAWSSFNRKLAYKAERAGKLFVQVDARGTSQICPVCGRVQIKLLSQRIHDCSCGYKDDRDHASSLVILERGIRKVRSERPELKLVDRRPLLLGNERQVVWMKQEAPPFRGGVVHSFSSLE